MSEAHQLEVTERDAGCRLDAFIAARLPEASRSTVQRWIEAGRVEVEGRPRKASFKVTVGERVWVRPLPPEPTRLIPEDLPLEILHEDEDLIILNKPAGLVVHPGAGNWSGTLANALAFHFRSLPQHESLRPGIVHRLDKGTSGVLVVAKHEYAHDFLAAQFQKRQVSKQYVALLYGHLPLQEGSIDVPIGRDRKARTRISPRTARPKAALTHYRVIRYVGEFTLVQAFPQTGRTHQIRVHFHHLGHPVVGDATYEKRGFAPRLAPAKLQAIRRFDRLFLHAASLTLVHPRTGETLTFEAPLPTQLAHLLQTLGE